MKFHLRDRNEKMAESWRHWFREVPDVEISCGDIFEAGKFDAIVSPANSYGFMDGGIDLVYSEHFGWGLQERLRNKLIQEYDGECPVGEAVIVPTENADIPWLVSAPTMRVPLVVSGTTNAYLAFRGVIRAVKKHNCNRAVGRIETVLCPGLGTAVGQMPYNVCAKQMFFAYLTCVKGTPQQVNELHDAVKLHYGLTRDM